MDKTVVACVQMRLRLYATLNEYREDLGRFMRAAEAKRARLVIFPELAGLLVAPTLLKDRRTALLLRAEHGRRRSAGVWDRLSGRAAGWMAEALKADLRSATAALLDVNAPRVLEAYTELFGGLARTHALTLVAPSAWLPAADGAIVNQSLVFGPDGSILGRQAKVLGYSEDDDIVGRGATWDAIPTEVGRLGLMVGSDVLYPEVGRVLAYQGAEMLVAQAACQTPAFYSKVRAGILARMQDNQLFAAASFAVGENPLRSGAVTPYQGKSALFAPQEMTPRYNGVLVEMGGLQSEGVLTAEWDFLALRRLWDSSDTPIRRFLPTGEAATLLAALYAQLRALPAPTALELLTGPTEIEGQESEQETPTTGAPVDAGATAHPATRTAHAAVDVPLHELDELPLLGSVSSHWPLQLHETVSERVDEDIVEWPSKRSYAEAGTTVTIRRDDETDEMDAVEGEAAGPATSGTLPSPALPASPAPPSADAAAPGDSPAEPPV